MFKSNHGIDQIIKTGTNNIKVINNPTAGYNHGVLNINNYPRDPTDICEYDLCGNPCFCCSENETDSNKLIKTILIATEGMTPNQIVIMSVQHCVLYRIHIDSCIKILMYCNSDQIDGRDFNSILFIIKSQECVMDFYKFCHSFLHVCNHIPTDFKKNIDSIKIRDYFIASKIIDGNFEIFSCYFIEKQYKYETDNASHPIIQIPDLTIQQESKSYYVYKKSSDIPFTQDLGIENNSIRNNEINISNTRISNKTYFIILLLVLFLIVYIYLISSNENQIDNYV
jgi:hypothetical protein